MNKKNRLDIFLLSKNMTKSRNKARELILNNKVKVNDDFINKTNFLVSDKDVVVVLNDKNFVSRAAVKLEYALEYFSIDLYNMNILDIGSSTGGFIQVCLLSNPNIIYGIEVGHNQLDESLKENPKIKYFEKLNFKNVDINMFEMPINFITCDVSFISCKKIISKILEIFSWNIKAIILLKPQFELSNNDISKCKGFVNDSKIHKKIIEDFKLFCTNNNIKIIDIIKSPIIGSKSGNIEFLVYLEFNF